jgi:hypothetical protein
MTRTFKTSSIAVALVGAALASVALAPGATAIPYEDFRSPGVVDAVAPPPSSIAASAGDAYQALRAPDARDAALAQERYLSSYGATVSQPVADKSPASDGFDWTSAAIGAAAGAGLLLVLIAVFAGTGKLGRRSIPTSGQSTASA